MTFSVIVLVSGGSVVAIHFYSLYGSILHDKQPYMATVEGTDQDKYHLLLWYDNGSHMQISRRSW